MKTPKTRRALLLATIILGGCEAHIDMEQQIDELYARMPQQERIAQLRSMYMDDLFDEQGRLDTAKCRELIPYGIGHFSQYASQKPRNPNELRDRVAAVQKWLIHNTPNGIPALFHEEVLSGINARGATIYPQQIGLACSFNPELAELKTLQTGTAMRRMGGLLSLSPMVDVCRTPSFNRLEESYGEDGYLSAVMGTAFVRGLQQGDLSKGVGACSKHYLGYGGGGDAEEKELMEEILLPHETMIRLEGSKALMPGYHAFNGTNCVANSEILQDILRNYLGFDGMVVSDYTAIDQLPAPEDLSDGKAWTPVEKAAAAINNGNDVDFPLGANYRYLQQAIDQGLVKAEVLERAVKDVLRYKFRAGMFDDNPYLYSTEDITLDTPEERQTSYDIATQSIVLLENKRLPALGDEPLLPLTVEKLARMHQLSSQGGSEAGTVLLTGPNANSMWAMCGDYSFPAMSYFWKKVENDLDHPHVVTLLEGIQNCLKTLTPNTSSPTSLLYERGCDWTDIIETKYAVGGDERAWEYEILHRKVNSGEKADKEEALRLARHADVIIAAVGENVMLCGENRDRQHLRLPGRQEQYVKELLSTGKPVVLVVFGGRAQIISAIADRCAAVIQAWYPGEEGGNAVADILFGKVSPSAKLSVSYPNEEVFEPLCYNYSSKPDSRVAWPFGYGLSYTMFEYSNLKLSTSEPQTADDSFTLTFEVKNIGKVAADEIAQIYLSPDIAADSMMQSLYRPIQLQGFARVSLQPGEAKTVSIRLYTEQLGYYSREGQHRQWNVSPGKFIIKVGASSADIRLQQLITLKGTTVSKPLREHYFSVNF